MSVTFQIAPRSEWLPLFHLKIRYDDSLPWLPEKTISVRFLAVRFSWRRFRIKRGLTASQYQEIEWAAERELWRREQEKCARNQSYRNPLKNTER